MTRIHAPAVRAVALLSCALTMVTAYGMRLRAQQPIPLTPGMVIDRSVVIKPGTYRLSASADLKTPAIAVRGENLSIDFNGAILLGGSEDADPDSYVGVGLLVDGGRQVTIRNAVIRGYKVGILARQSPELHLAQNDLSYNWKQRLYSGIEKESLVDWMSYHHNEGDEWLRYGAAIYLSECDRAQIERNRAVQGQNGLMVTRSRGLRIWNNTLQFLSGIGVGLYRTTDSTIMHNRIDWCVRGYSHGFYNRGQDSAGLLMYEQSSGNTVAYNSITHGGDGLFLWAGQSTMDTGQGGSNDNLFYENDFSHAPTNGIEATFSRNVFVKNRVEECWHGVWGGYSYDSKWFLNRFVNNSEGIAIEHGQRNRIDGNAFSGGTVAVRLWQNPSQDPDWGYPKHRDTASHDYDIRGNGIRGSEIGMDIRDTAGVRLVANGYWDVARPFVTSGRTPGFQPDPPGMELIDTDAPLPPPRIADGIEATIPLGQRRGRDTIIVDEWGPYDWRSPKLWPAGKPDDRPLTLRVLGPEGEWRVARLRGATVSAQSGRVPGEVVVTPAASALVDVNVALEYRGGEVTSPRGASTPAGSPHLFEYSRFFVPVDWKVRFYEYGEADDPIKQPPAFAKRLTGAPLKTVAADRLDYLSGRAIEVGVPSDRFAIVAEGTAAVPAGDYILRVISDDGARVWVDGELVLDAWEPHESRVDTVPLQGGTRRFKVEYYEIGGFAELRFTIQRK
jgi:nitrous oxidase accessory protein NosD